MKTRELVERELDSAVKADDIESRFKAIKEQALRSLSPIFSRTAAHIKLGPRHKFSVNTQVDLTIIPRNDVLNLHLTGTDYFGLLKHSWRCVIIGI